MKTVIREHSERPDEPFRKRLLGGLAESIVDVGYRSTTVADIVSRAHTSRRTFYEHFNDKEECFVELLKNANADMIRHISGAVDPSAPWVKQVRQAIEAWIACAESNPLIIVSWIRDLPALGAEGSKLQREMMDAFVTMVQTLSNTQEWRSLRAEPVSRQLAMVLLGGLREVIATTLEEGGRAADVTEVAVSAAIALMAPPGGMSARA